MTNPVPSTWDLLRLRLDADLPASCNREDLLDALRDVLGPCTIEDASLLIRLDPGRRVEVRSSARVILYIRAQSLPTDPVGAITRACERTGLTTWSVSLMDSIADLEVHGGVIVDPDWSDP